MNTVQSSRNSKNVRMLGSAYLCASVLLTCESLSGGQGYFHREDAKSAKKSDFKNFAFFASSRWFFWVAAGLLCVHRWLHFVRFMQTKILAACEGFLASDPDLHTRNLHTRMRFRICPSARRVSRTNRDVAVLCGSVLPRTCAPGRRRVDQLKHNP